MYAADLSGVSSVPRVRCMVYAADLSGVSSVPGVW